MKLLIHIILIYNLFSFVKNANLTGTQQVEQTLITSLLTGYNKNIRPDDQVSVDITASLQQIISIDEKQQIMTSSSFISQTWFDDRLSWNKSNYNNIEVVMLPVKSLWIPDTMILNSADSSGYLTVNDYSLASVDDSGQVYMILPALTIKTRCNLVVLNFPFDRQVCSINLTSWAQGSNRVLYTENNSLVIDLSGYIEHPLWDLNGTDMIVFHAEDRAPFEYTYNDVISIQLYIRRKPLFFIMNGIFACLVLNFATLLSYVLPFATQIGLCMTCFMTYSVYSLNFSNLFPQQSLYLMMITLYFLLSIGWTLLSMGWFVICNRFMTKGEMPTSLYKFCGWLQKIFFCCFPQSKDVKVNNNSQSTKSGNNLSIINVRRSNQIDSIDKKQCNVGDGIEFIKTNETENMNPFQTTTAVVRSFDIHESISKCNFCSRCKSCQSDVDKDKMKTKTKKELEGRCKALNYFVLFCITILMLVSNLAVWLLMSK